VAGIRKLGVSGHLVGMVLQTGTEYATPTEPLNGCEILDVRYDLTRGVVWLLIRSLSFEGGEDANWETAEVWNATFRRPVV